MEEMEQERKQREKEERERAERAQKLKTEFSDSESQWDKDKSELHNLEAEDARKKASSGKEKTEADTAAVGKEKGSAEGPISPPKNSIDEGEAGKKKAARAEDGK